MALLPTSPLVVLGTSSKYRRPLFTEHFPHFRAHLAAPNIDEKAITAAHADPATEAPSSRSRSDPAALTRAIAHAKADALLPILQAKAQEEKQQQGVTDWNTSAADVLLLTSDQVVTYEGVIREKPVDEAQCRAFLRSYATAPVRTVSAVVVVRASDGARWDGVDVAAQHFSAMPESVIDALVAKGDVMYCAGGVTVEDELLAPYRAERDGEIESIMGLPVSLVRSLLERAGFPPVPTSS